MAFLLVAHHREVLLCLVVLHLVTVHVVALCDILLLVVPLRNLSWGTHYLEGFQGTHCQEVLWEVLYLRAGLYRESLHCLDP